MSDQNELVLFQTIDEQVKLNVAIEGETAWLSQQQMVELFNTTKQNISLHINNCFREGELEPDSVVKDSLTTALDGKMYNVTVGLPSLAFSDKPIPITVWVNEKSNTIAKVEIDKINVIQAMFDKNIMVKEGKVTKVEKAILTYKVIGINTFDEIPMP